jgi:hypothetical protein
VQYSDAAPNSLNLAAKDQYRSMIAMAFRVDANLGRARQRLALLNDSSPAQALAAQATQILDPFSVEGKALAALAEGYNPRPTVQATSTPTVVTLQPTRAPTGVLSPTTTLDAGQAVRTATRPPTATATITPTITPTPAATQTPRPTNRPSPTLGAPFALKDKQKVCDANLPALLQIEVFDSAGKPVPGVLIRVTWPPAGQDTFYTGLSPEISIGYADFQMTPKLIYTAQAGENGEVVSGLGTQDCPQQDGSGSFPGGWKIKFVQP